VTEAPHSGYTVPGDDRILPRGLTRAAIALWVAGACLVIEATLQTISVLLGRIPVSLMIGALLVPVINVLFAAAAAVAGRLLQQGRRVGRTIARPVITIGLLYRVGYCCLMSWAFFSVDTGKAFFPFDTGQTYDGQVHFNPGATLVVLNQAAIIVALVVADYPLRSESVRLYFDPQRPVP